MSDDTKAARERLRRIAKGESYASVYKTEFVLGGYEEADRQKIVDNDLASNPPDDDEAIDEAFLRSVGAENDDHPHKWTFHREDALSIGLWNVGDGWKAMLRHAAHAATCIVRGIKTRGQLRRLCLALGIPLTERRK